MPYAAPTTSPALNPLDMFCPLRKNKEDSPTTDNSEMSREYAIQEVMEIISTSPQFSTSLRRKSAPESYSKKHSLKVDLPSPLAQEFPLIIRKKSGEVVKPSLKKSKSEPATPISAFPKYVHFDTDLEQIKLFNETQRPQAVSAEASDEDDDTDEDDVFSVFSFSPDDEEVEEYDDEPELSIYLPNKPLMTTFHSSKPVFVENIFLSRDKKTLQGRVMVQNIAFQKSVHVRYTFDFWSTVSEVSANYEEGVPTKDNKNSFDVFVFSIDLIDNSRNPIDGKTMYFAVHYSVEGKDFWDNNDGSNFQVNFKRVPSQPKSKNNSLQNVASTWSMASIHKPNKDMGESFIHSPPTLTNTTDTKKRSSGRYDIAVSLSMAQNTPRSALPVDNTRAQQPSYFPAKYGNDNYNLFFPNNFIDGMPSELASSPSSVFEPLTISNPISIPTSKPVIGSSSYYDLLNQYCFYSSSPPIFASS